MKRTPKAGQTVWIKHSDWLGHGEAKITSPVRRGEEFVIVIWQGRTFSVLIDELCATEEEYLRSIILDAAGVKEEA